MLILADARSIPLRDGSVNCCVTSPPYWGLRDYGTPGQLGLESTPEEYVAAMVAVFRDVRRVLREDGTLWLNLGDSYNAGTTAPSKPSQGADVGGWAVRCGDAIGARRVNAVGLKPKDLVGIPWRVAFALQTDGWYLRSDIIWAKPNPMPESVRDRPTKAHEYVFLMSKSARYFYDAEAIKETAINAGKEVRTNGNDGMAHNFDGNRTRDGFRRGVTVGDTRNVRSVWNISTKPYAGAHFATMPEALAERCILAGSPAGGMVLDPFVGSGTTVRVARSLGRHGVGLDVSERYLTEQAAKRVRVTQGLLL